MIVEAHVPVMGGKQVSQGRSCMTSTDYRDVTGCHGLIIKKLDFRPSHNISILTPAASYSPRGIIAGLYHKAASPL